MKVFHRLGAPTAGYDTLALAAAAGLIGFDHVGRIVKRDWI